MTKWVCAGDLSDYELRRFASSPSFVPAWAKCDDRGLMEVTISEPVRDCFTGKYLGRELFDYYPRDFLMPGQTTFGPEQALEWGGDFYSEGLSYTSKDMLDIRRGCFRSSELLYLHAAIERAWSGFQVAFRCLGYVYEYDRTCGNLWPLWMDEIPKTYHKVLQIKDRKERAYECYKIAMEEQDVEATYKFGDMLKKGCGCDVDLKGAFGYYNQAWEMAESECASVYGSVAFRLGEAYEKALGCSRNLKKSRQFYERAVFGLEVSQNDTSLYDRVLIESRKGLKRVNQEIGFFQFAKKLNKLSKLNNLKNELNMFDVCGIVFQA